MKKNINYVFYPVFFVINSGFSLKISQVVAFADTILWVFVWILCNAVLFFVKFENPLENGFRGMLIKASLISFSVFVSFFLLEFGVRVSNLRKSKPVYLKLHPIIGWESCEVASFTEEIPGFGKVSYSTRKNGFRLRRESNPRKDGFFVIGDSFTQATQVSDGKCYYDKLAQNFEEYDFYVYGCGGYGSLQESMTLEKYLKDTNSKIVLWQFCGNDFVENLHQIERNSFMFQPHAVRPYLEDGMATYRFSRKTVPLGGFLFTRSSVLHYFLFMYDQSLKTHDPFLSVEFSLTPELLQESVKVTSEIMNEVKCRVAPSHLICFSVDRNEKFREICMRLGIDYIDGVQDELKKMEAIGKKVNGLPYDGHWNEAGHEIAGNYLCEKMSTLFRKQ